MKKFLFLLLLLPSVVFAQRVISHTVVAKESYSSIGRLYNINGRELADFNNLDYTVGLNIGQVLKVPVKGNTPSPSPTPEPVKTVDKTSQPIYHTLKQGESLYQLSRLYAPTTVDNLRQWNNLSSDNLILGDQLIVGYNKGSKVAAVEPKKEETPVAAPKAKPVEPIKNTEEADLKAEAKRLEAEQARLEAQAAQVKKQQDALEAKRLAEEKKQLQKEAEKAARVKVSNTDGAGFFKKDFEGNEGATSSGKAGVFKSTSGWEDEKYYALFDAARPGTILKITNKETGKVVYAKVLDIIPKLSENKNMALRLSNAAASALGADESDFECSIAY